MKLQHRKTVGYGPPKARLMGGGGLAAALLLLLVSTPTQACDENQMTLKQSVQIADPGPLAVVALTAMTTPTSTWKIDANDIVAGMESDDADAVSIAMQMAAGEDDVNDSGAVAALVTKEDGDIGIKDLAGSQNVLSGSDDNFLAIDYSARLALMAKEGQGGITEPDTWATFAMQAVENNIRLEMDVVAGEDDQASGSAAAMSSTDPLSKHVYFDFTGQATYGSGAA